MRLAGKVAIVTGGGTGIGRAIAQAFGREGARVVVAGRRPAPLAETAATIHATGAEAHAIPCDITDAASIQALIDATLAACGRVDVLVNNAAATRPAGALDETAAAIDPGWWSHTLDVNLTGYLRCTQAALPALLANGSGSIINVASTSGIAGNTNQTAYVASKHAVVGLTRAVALDYAARGVRVNAICPGFIETDRSLGFSVHNRGEDWRAAKLAAIPVGRFGRPEEVAALAVFLASDEAPFLTGTVIPIDGGTAAKRG